MGIWIIPNFQAVHARIGRVGLWSAGAGGAGRGAAAVDSVLKDGDSLFWRVPMGTPRPPPQVVITDVLTGTPPACNGLICQLTGVSSGPLVARRVVMLALAGGVAAPLLLLRCVCEKGRACGGIASPACVPHDAQSRKTALVTRYVLFVWQGWRGHGMAGAAGGCLRDARRVSHSCSLGSSDYR